MMVKGGLEKSKVDIFMILTKMDVKEAVFITYLNMYPVLTHSNCFHRHHFKFDLTLKFHEKL